MSPRYLLKFEGEIRFGPPYFRLTIDDKDIPNSLFGEKRAELQGGRYLATEEWLTTDYNKGPVTRVAIFDLERGLVAKLKSVDQGFVHSFQLKDAVFTYIKEFQAKGTAIQSEVEWSEINNWVPWHS